jgi:hypothetical protein
MEQDQDIFIKIARIEEDIQTINTKLDSILAILNTDCKKMSDHIDFIEQVYENVKHPLNYVMNSVSNLISDSRRIQDDPEDS